MKMTDKQELQKTIDVAVEFLERAEDLMAEIDRKELANLESWRYAVISPATTSALRRQSMELTRQLAVLRRV